MSRPTNRSAQQVVRMLALVPYLQAHPDADLAATAQAFGVTPRRLLADLEVLWFVGLPGGMPGDLIVYVGIGEERESNPFVGAYG